MRDGLGYLVLCFNGRQTSHSRYSRKTYRKSKQNLPPSQRLDPGSLVPKSPLLSSQLLLNRPPRWTTLQDQLRLSPFYPLGVLKSWHPCPSTRGVVNREGTQMLCTGRSPRPGMSNFPFFIFQKHLVGSIQGVFRPYLKKSFPNLEAPGERESHLPSFFQFPIEC